MLVESFFENVNRDGSNQVLHFIPKPAGTMLIACLYAEWRDPKGGTPLLSFAAITDEPPVEVAAAGHDRMIINLKPENLTAWLAPAGRSTDELQRILARARSQHRSSRGDAARPVGKPVGRIVGSDDQAGTDDN
jgi:putative SOS response-associated peptidase YedK